MSFYRKGTKENRIFDPSDPNMLLIYGQFLNYYPDICPFCFSKYPDGEIEKTEHILKCKRIAQEAIKG